MPPLDVYLQYQKILLTEEERERREVDNAVEVSAKALLTMEAQELPPPTAIPDLAPSQLSVNQSSVKGMLGYLQDHVAKFVGWLLGT